jgi:DNA-binding NarL/FixJ family response regulator
VRAQEADMVRHNASSPIRILICDDHALIRAGTRHIFERAADFEVVGEAADGAAAVEAAWQLRPDVVVMDIRMPGMGGIEATRQIRERCPETAVLALTAYADETYASRMIEAGATGYLLKTARACDLCEAARLVRSGAVAIDRALAGSLARVCQQPVLTGREMDVLRAICRGLPNRQIALELDVSVRTVERHVEAILRRLDVNSRTEAARHAVARGWAPRSAV